MSIRLPTALSAALLTLFISACSSTGDLFDDVTTSSVRPVAQTAENRDCLARAMFFESHRSSREGLVAVGTVVMNRVASDSYPDTVCGVVAQKNQFAPGVMTRPMQSKAMPDVMAAADAVLKGERHPMVGKAKFFHQAGLNFPYNNMHYVLRAGGNAFYERVPRAQRAERQLRPQSQLAAAGRVEGTAAAGPVQVAQAQQRAESQATPAALSFDVEPTKADAIGAMILRQAEAAAEE